MLRDQVELPVAALATCLRWERLGEGHPVIAELPVWRDAAARRANDAATRAALAEQDLLDGDRLRPGFLAALRTLSRPGIEYACWARDATSAASALVAGDGTDAVLAIRNGERLRLSTVPAPRMAHELVALLPPAAPAPSQSITVRRSDYERFRSTGVQILHEVSNPAPVDRLYAILRRPRECAAELHAALRTRTGVRRRARQRTLVDNDQGRWLIYLRPDDWIVAVPVAKRDLIEALHQMIDGIR